MCRTVFSNIPNGRKKKQQQTAENLWGPKIGQNPLLNSFLKIKIRTHKGSATSDYKSSALPLDKVPYKES